MSDSGVYLVLILIVVIFLFPIVLSIIAIATASSLRRELESLKQRLGAGPPVTAPPPAQPSAPPPPTVEQSRIVQPPAAVVQPGGVAQPSAAAAQPKTGVNLERLIGGKWLNWIGIIALLFGTAFFLKYAFDNNWIGPLGRVTIGLIAGTALIVYSQYLYRKTYVYFAEGIAGLGAGILFLSLYAAWHFYQLMPNVAAFGGMAGITVVLLGLSLERNSQRMALLALIGGFITPLLVGTGASAEIQLFGYLAVLNAGLLWVAYARNWRSLPLAFIFSLLYFWSWYASHYDPTKLGPTLTFAAIFFVEFTTLPVLRALKTGSLYPEDVPLVLLNTAWFVLALHVMLFENQRWSLTLVVVALALVNLAIARLAPPPAKGTPLARVLYAGLALTLITLVIPIRLAGAWITVGWAIEGAVLIWTGFSTQTRLFRVAGLIIYVLVATRLVVAPITGGHFIFNSRFETFALVIACFGVTAFLASRRRAELPRDEYAVYRVVQVAINVLALWALTSEVLDARELGERQSLFVTLVWTLYAAVLLVLGVSANSGLLRWQGLILLGIAIIKVFVFDLSELGLGLRILSFMALGIVLLGISFIYQRLLKASRPEDKA